MARDTIYNDHAFPMALTLTTLPQVKHKTFQGHKSPTAPTKLWFLLPFTDANFEDRTQTNYSNLVVGKHNLAGGMIGQNAKLGYIHNPPIHENFLRGNTPRIQPHGNNPFRPYRIGSLMPTRGLKGRYQYKDAYYVNIDHVISPLGEKVMKPASTISSSAYAWNSEIKFNPYVSIYPPPDEGGQASSAGVNGSDLVVELGFGGSNLNSTEITYSSNATVVAFSPYSEDFGGENYSSTSNQSQSLSASQMSNQQNPISSNPITSY
jgi:hypothetical protein